MSSAAQCDLIEWYGEMVNVVEHMSPEDRADLDVWERARDSGTRTSEWPRWSEFMRPFPGDDWDTDAPETPMERYGLPDGFYVYRLWSRDTRLLYVGVTVRPAARLRTHQRRWGHLIASVTWERHPDAESMLEAERIAICQEYPALNKVGV